MNICVIAIISSMFINTCEIIQYNDIGNNSCKITTYSDKYIVETNCETLKKQLYKDMK